MIRIDQRAPVTNAGPAGATRRSGGAAFALPTKDTTTSTASAGVSATGPLDSLLALQANEDAGERKRRQARRGHDLLDGLDILKASLLAGRVPLVQLERLKAMLSSRRESTDDPRLDEVLAHIELRAAVELAKLQR
jgi:hypothetical protein